MKIICKKRLHLTMENILDLIEEKENLYRPKTKVYNETLKSYMLIFNQIKNLDFSAKVKYNEIDFTTIIIDNNIGNISIQDNIFMKFDTLDFLNKELSEKINEISEIVNLCKDYSKLEKENKKLIKDGYALYRYIQILCTTSYYKHRSEHYLSMYTSIQNELKSRFWLSWNVYINNLFKK